MSSPDNKNVRNSRGKTIDNPKLVYNMTTADEMPDDKNLRGNDVASMIGEEDADDVTIDDDADNKKTGVAGKKETDSSDAEITLDPVSNSGLLSDYDLQWPKTPSSVPSSSKTSTTGDNPNLDEHHVAEDDVKEYNMEDVGKDANEVDGGDDVEDNVDDDDDEDVNVDEDEDEDEDEDVDEDEDEDEDVDVDEDEDDSKDALYEEEADDKPTEVDESMDNKEEVKDADYHVAKTAATKRGDAVTRSLVHQTRIL
jgi:hypothetical protein